VRRREFIGLVGGATAAWPIVARAQSGPTIGFLYQGPPTSPVMAARLSIFRQGLSEHGLTEGRNITVDYRAADRADQLPVLAAELVNMNVRAIVAMGSEAAHAAQRATRTIPIVMTSSSDPVGTGLVSSLARPGGNITGMSLASPDLAGKRLEILKELGGDIAVVAAIWKSDDPPASLSLKETQAAAAQLGARIIPAGVRSSADFADAFARVLASQTKAMIVLPAPLMTLNAAWIVDFANQQRLPVVAFDREFPKAGGLASYGASVNDSIRRSAAFVMKILNGANPSDLPVQQPTQFEFVINLKAAKTIGLNVPLYLQQRADEVIE
jgi:putative ABC transport system substrate-binding protein